MKKGVQEILDSLNNSPSGPPVPGRTGDGGIYFVGIGGIGMSALARYFNAKKLQSAVMIKHKPLLPMSWKVKVLI